MLSEHFHAGARCIAVRDVPSEVIQPRTLLERLAPNEGPVAIDVLEVAAVHGSTFVFVPPGGGRGRVVPAAVLARLWHEGLVRPVSAPSVGRRTPPE